MKGIQGHIKLNSIAQLLVCFVLLFIIPVLPDHFQRIGYFSSFIVLILVSAALIEVHNRRYVTIALVIIVSRIINDFLGFEYVALTEDLITVLLFVWIALLLIKQVMTKDAGMEIILEAIAGYLLLGIALTLVMGIIVYLQPGSFQMGGEPLGSYSAPFTNNSYFVFVTYTTVGYGDILPVGNLARSFSKLVAVCGQLYISVVIAILIGKYTQTR